MTAPTLAHAPDQTGNPGLARLPTAFVCTGCGFRSDPTEPVPMRCPAAPAMPWADHVLRRSLDAAQLAFPGDTDPNPFIRYRTLFHGYHVALRLGWSDADWLDVVRGLDGRIAAIDGHGFVLTPLVAARELAHSIGMATPVLVKDETANVGGSHKARHLMGTVLELEVAEALERLCDEWALETGAGDEPGRPAGPLAIASCGNAGLAATIVARAWGRDLRVFVPVETDREVIERLHRLGATITAVAREPGVPGDPAYHDLRRALDRGAVPFTCQGNLNGLAIEGGLTLGYEIADQLRAKGRVLDRLFVQVGGGALASACAQALEEATQLGALARMPRIHAVQTAGAAPLVRAWDRVATHLAGLLAIDTPAAPTAADRPGLAERLHAAAATPAFATELGRVPLDRARFMWPWETEPHSIAGGILDDETYDWFAVVRAMLLTGGYPVVVGEASVEEANRVGRETTGIGVDHTGSAGLAGLLDLRRRGEVDPGEAVGVLFTGVRRAPPPDPPSRGPAHGEPT
jgi:threonine synthase